MHVECAACGSSRTWLHSRLPDGTARYKCKECAYKTYGIKSVSPA